LTLNKDTRHARESATALVYPTALLLGDPPPGKRLAEHTGKGFHYAPFPNIMDEVFKEKLHE